MEVMKVMVYYLRYVEREVEGYGGLVECGEGRVTRVH